MHRISMMLLILVLPASFLPAAEPPGLLNYQGVLRNASDEPLTGDHDMTFLFFENEWTVGHIMGDAHTAGDSTPVTVTDGVFNVQLGSGYITDGISPGIYTSLADLFRDYGEVWMEVRVNGSNLSPRIRIVAAPYSLNADNLDGMNSTSFLNTSSTAQTKNGRLSLDVSETGVYAIEAVGQSGGGYFADSDGSGYANLGTSNIGIEAYGSLRGGYFADTDSGSYAYVAYGNHGIDGYGSTVGGYFQDTTNSGRGYIGYGDRGVSGYGSEAGGYFSDTNSSGYAFAGYGDIGLQGNGVVGIHGTGSLYGGEFSDSDGSGYARAASGDRGIEGYGYSSGGYFKDSNNSGYAYVGTGDRGMEGYGTEAGGYFEDTDSGGYAYLGHGDIGVEGSGIEAGGYFEDPGQSGQAYLARGNVGIDVYGSDTAGMFENTGGTSYAWVAGVGKGLEGHGNDMGGHFSDLTSTTWTSVARGSASTMGSGAKNFIQNHPYDTDRIVVYTALEGDEVGTYTRGTGRLVDGEARVALGETFQWVTNPDIGLTAQVTPRSPDTALYVASVTTEELVVRAVDGFATDARFDYLVSGLRIGFEEASVIREKDREARIPSMADDRERYAKEPGLRTYNALERFKTMREGVGLASDMDMGASLALKAAISEYDPAKHGPVVVRRPDENEARDEKSSSVGSLRTQDETVVPRDDRIDDIHSDYPVTPVAPMDDPIQISSDPALISTMPATESMENGDIAVFDLVQPGLLSLSRISGDTALFGVVVESTAAGKREVTVAHTGVVDCKVDASYGAIRPGDLLTTSPTPGHAMAVVNPLPGTVLGKAIEQLDEGAGTIRVLVTMR